MHLRTALLLGVLGTVFCPFLRANGKFYHQEEIPAGVPYQRAFIMEEDAGETLILQSQYDAGRANVYGVGWVVPVPNVPELASMPAGHEIFHFLEMQTHPNTAHYGHFVAIGICAAGIVLAFFLFWRYPKGRAAAACGAILLLVLALDVGPYGAKDAAIVCASVAIVAVCMSVHYPGPSLAVSICIGCLWFMAPNVNHGRGLEASANVEILRRVTVGVYDAAVVRAETPEALIAWLDGSGLVYGEGDTAAFQSYIDRGWCFVVAKIVPDVAKKTMPRGGLAAPLIMRFETDRLVYPLVLTSLTSGETQVLLYTLSDHRLACDDRMDMKAASVLGQYVDHYLYHAKYGLLTSEDVTPRGFFPSVETDLLSGGVPAESSVHSGRYLCKFRGTLTPEQMSTDLYFRQAEIDEPYRERIWQW